jgi:hypothetical protein
MTKPRKHGVALRLSRCHMRGEARMMKDEGMTKSEGRDAPADGSFCALRRAKPRKAKCIRRWGFIILSAFGIRISAFSRV